MKETSVYLEILNSLAAANMPFEEQSIKDESPSNHIMRLLKAVAKLPEESWKALSNNTQKWYNEGAVSLKNKRMVSPPEGYVLQNKKVTEAVNKMPSEMPPPEIRRPFTKVVHNYPPIDEAAVFDAVATPAEEAQEPVRIDTTPLANFKPSKVDRIRLAVIGRPNATMAEMKQMFASELASKEISATTFQTVIYDTRRILTLLSSVKALR